MRRRKAIDRENIQKALWQRRDRRGERRRAKFRHNRLVRLDIQARHDALRLILPGIRLLIEKAEKLQIRPVHVLREPPHICWIFAHRAFRHEAVRREADDFPAAGLLAQIVRIGRHVRRAGFQVIAAFMDKPNIHRRIVGGGRAFLASGDQRLRRKAFHVARHRVMPFFIFHVFVHDAEHDILMNVWRDRFDDFPNILLLKLE